MNSEAVGLPGEHVGDERASRGGPDSDRLEGQTDERVRVWGVPFAPLTLTATLKAIFNMIEAGKPSHIITANTHYVMLSEHDRELRLINDKAALIVADGMPLVWGSRLNGSPLPERVAGSDMLPLICEQAAGKGYRLFLLGGAEGVADEAAQRLTARYPGLQFAGTACPPFREWTPEEDAELIGRIRSAKTDILLLSLTMPRADRWIAAHLDALGVPVVFNVGAAVDFAAGRVRRAPRWMQKLGLEWAFRIGLEPRRLFGRYARNAWFIARMLARDVGQATRGRRSPRTP
jgi:N-acetylglucosaminyldiphosphoundecaprenol N-acetyl-beta-D-mannosaminyltransferase